MSAITIKEPIRDAKTHENETKGKNMRAKIQNIFGAINYVPGIQFIRDQKNKLLALSQASYIDKILVRFLMENSKIGNLPFRHGVHLSKEQCPKTPQEIKDMRQVQYVSAH